MEAKVRREPLPMPPVRPDTRFHIHAGFARTGTKLLQRQVFPRIPSHAYWGAPYGNLGGAFTMIRHVDGMEFSLEECAALIGAHAPTPQTPVPVIISDEVFTETSHWFYAPAVVSRDMIMQRLRSLFGEARILFTIRRQPDYAVSVYLNILRNYMEFAGVLVPPFAIWYRRSMEQFRSQALRNLDFSVPIRTYAACFGTENVEVLPIEMLADTRIDEWRERLRNFLASPESEIDASWLSGRENDSPTSFDQSLYRALGGSAAQEMILQFAERGTNVFETLRMPSPAQADSPQVNLPPDIEKHICETCSRGNAWIADTFGLPLEALGYPVEGTQ